jgi:zinc D-Ala-D-Ala carboxypeptidase
MPRRASDIRYSAARRRRRRRRVFAAAATILCLCVAAYAFVSLDRPWTTASSGETPAEDGSSTANMVETSAVEDTGDPPGGSDENSPSSKKPLPPPKKSCDDPRVLVGKGSALPPGYEPDDLVSLTAYGVPVYGGDQFVRRGAAKPLAKLASAAASDGHELLVSSAYRSYFDQQQNFAHFTGIYGDDAEIVSAPPGQSQHQLGTTVDFTNAEVGYQLLPAFGETGASKWLEDNAWRHGFVITYPNGDEQGTGRQWEPWEYRHVGKNLAEEIHDSGMSLREFLTEEGVRPLC